MIILGLMLAAVLAVNWNQDPGTIEVTINTGVEFVVTGPDGKRSGFDPSIHTRFDEINESYGVMSIDSEDPEIEAPPSVNEFITYSPAVGEYQLRLVGISSIKYNLNILLARGKKGDSKVFDIMGVIDSNQTIGYRFQFNREFGSPFFVLRTFDNHSLRQDLDNCFKLDLFGKKPLYIDLSHRVEKYEGWIQKADTAKARLELEKLGKKLDEVYEKSKGKSHDPNHFIKEDGYRILKEDVLLSFPRTEARH